MKGTFNKATYTRAFYYQNETHFSLNWRDPVWEELIYPFWSGLNSDLAVIKYFLQYTFSTLSSTGPRAGKDIGGDLGAPLNRRPQILALFFTSRPHLNLFSHVIKASKTLFLLSSNVALAICRYICNYFQENRLK